MRGIAAAGEEAGIVQDRGRGADGGEPAVGGVVAEHEGAHADIGTEVFHAGAAGEEEAVEGPRGVGGFDGGEEGVGVDSDAAAAGDAQIGAEGGDGDLGACAAQEVDGGERFDFLKTFREDCENRWHGANVTRMSPAADGNFSGKRLVIFGCGYVGAEVAREAVARGCRVTALTRNPAKAEALRTAGVEAVVADLAGSEWHARIAGGADGVLNCVSSGGGGIEGYRRSYVEGMASIVMWAQTRGTAGTMIYTGSTSVYPQGGGARVDETAPTVGAGERAQLLLEAERLLRTSEGAAARWFVLRLAGIYGPGRHHLLEQVRAGEVAGRGDYRLNLIHRDDIAAAIWAALEAPPTVANEVFNLADDGAATKADVVAWLAARLGVATPRFTGEPAAGRREVTPDRAIVADKARALLGWRPRYATFREGYEKIVSR